MALLTASTSVPATIYGKDLPQKTILDHNPEILSKDQWDAFVAVHDILLPSESDVPGAWEINATAFLQWVISDTELDSEYRETLKNGLIELNETALQNWEVPFLQMTPVDRAKLISDVESDTWGHYWLSELLFHLFEALLSDPIYGGNVDAVGWKWLGHIPGQPRPNVGYSHIIEKFSKKTAPH